MFFTKGSGYSQERDLVYDRTPPHGAIMCQPGPLPHNTVHPRFLHNTTIKKKKQYEVLKHDKIYSNATRMKCKNNRNILNQTISPATQSFNPFLFFRKFRFMILCYFKCLERDVRVVFFHSNHNCRIPYMSNIHVNATDHNNTGCGA